MTSVVQISGNHYPDSYPVILPNGTTWRYWDKQKAENAKLIARALAAMPYRSYKSKWYNPVTQILEITDIDTSTVAKWGQQWALAKALGYYNHTGIYNLLRNGGLPKGDRLDRLKAIAYSVPENWYEESGYA